jgi:hypothetical protein
MKSDKVRLATMLVVPSAVGNNTSVGALMSIDRAGSAASTPRSTVKQYDSGAIRNSFASLRARLTPIHELLFDRRTHCI